MSVALIILHIIVCFVLIGVILLQAGRGQGLGGASFGGGNVQSILGTKASSFLTKATGVCAILFLFTCIGLTLMEAHKSRSLFTASKAAEKAPLDVEQVRKALEKIKKTDAATAAQDEAAETAAVVDEAAAAAAGTKAEAETAAK